MKRLAGSRGICLDAYCIDSENAEYDIEVQRGEAGAKPKRARYHASVLDLEYLKAGHDFEELRKNYVIFITETDKYNQGEAIYPIERVNRVTGETFDDDQHILYVNASYQGDDEIGKLMHDFLCADPEQMLTKEMKTRATYLKKDPKGVKVMCKIMEDLREEAEARGENRLGALMQKLLSAGRTDDAMRASTDKEYRQELFKQYGLA